MTDLPDTEALRKAIPWLDEKAQPEWSWEHFSAVASAARCMNDLLVKIGPERVRSLIEGTRIDVPIEPSKDFYTKWAKYFFRKPTHKCLKQKYKAMLLAHKDGE